MNQVPYQVLQLCLVPVVVTVCCMVISTSLNVCLFVLPISTKDSYTGPIGPLMVWALRTLVVETESSKEYTCDGRPLPTTSILSIS